MASNNSNILNDTPQIKKLTRGRQRKIDIAPPIEIQIPVQQNSDIISNRTRNKSQSSDGNVELVVKEIPRRTRKTKQQLDDMIVLPKKEPQRRTRKSKLSLETEIQLANEVVRTQLAPKWRKKLDPPVTETTKEEHIIENRIEIKFEEDIDGSPNIDTANHINSKIPANKVKKTANNKTESVKKPPSECPNATKKRSADSTQKPAKIRKVATVDTEPQKPKKKQPVKRTVQRKTNPPRKKSIQGKDKLDGTVSGVGNYPPEPEIVRSDIVQEPTAAAIETRKESNASASNLSWTKDISSSSTTTCLTVCSNDFVRIDNKIPILQLTNVEHEVDKYKKTDDQDDTTSDSESSTSSDSSCFRDLVDVPNGSLNLSTSSLTSIKGNNEPSNHVSIKGDVTKALIRLSSMLKNFDMEIMNWIGYGDCVDDETKKYNDKILNVLKEENEVITHCRQLKRIFSNKPPEEIEILDTKVKGPSLSEEYDGSDNPISKDNVLLNHNAEYEHSPKTPSACTEDCDFTLDNFPYTSFEDKNDDDDALSLFAESITGIDSNSDHMGGSPATINDLDELDGENDGCDLQQRHSSCSSKQYNYASATITTKTDAIKRSVCEKQNADSTSLYKESVAKNMSDGEIEDSICGNPQPEFDIMNDSAANVDDISSQVIPPQSVLSIFQFRQKKNSVVFRGVCHYNLRDSCKNPRCPYPHIKPNPAIVKEWLVALSEETFLEEYGFIRTRVKLRRKYGMCFVQECHRRGLIRNLVEMAIDFTVSYKPYGQKDLDLQVAVLEFILLGLNDVGLAPFEDLLNLPVAGENLLCHVFMSVIARSQNFTRFKYVFVNLTNVMVRHRRTFDLNVAGNILERVCILPPEESLLRSVFHIIRNTDPTILKNGMISAFEARLRTLQCEWLEEFLTVKNEFVTPVVETKQGMLLEPLNVNCSNNEQERYTSPDTTKVDTMLNNPMSEPMITRTVNFTRTCHNTQTPTGRLTEDWLQNNDFNHWRRNAPSRPPPPLVPSLFARPLFRPRIVRQIHRTSPTVCKVSFKGGGDDCGPLV